MKFQAPKFDTDVYYLLHTVIIIIITTRGDRFGYIIYRVDMACDTLVQQAEDVCA